MYSISRLTCGDVGDAAWLHGYVVQMASTGLTYDRILSGSVSGHYRVAVLGGVGDGGDTFAGRRLKMLNREGCLCGEE